METSAAPAFFLAARDGDTETVSKMLSTAGAQSLHGLAALLAAERMGHTAIATLIRNTRQKIANSVARQAEVQKKMLSTAGAQSLINYQNELRATPHIFAAGKGHVAVTAMLIEVRCNVDLHDKEGFTPLYIAAQEGHAAATKQLIEARCNVDPQLPCGATPLFIAAQNGHAGVTKQLIEARCNIDLQMEDASTPLFIAAEKGHAAVTEQLIEARCNIDAQKKNGVSPLFIAAEKGHAAVTEQLIAARCNVDVQKKNGVSPLFIAAEKGQSAEPSATSVCVTVCGPKLLVHEVFSY